MNCIAFSLYGSNPRYLIGAVENARMAGEFYKGWMVHVWWDASVWYGKSSPAHIFELLDLGVFLHATPAISNGMFWRFLVHDLPGVERYIVRDVDSRFSEREVKAVNEWITSGKQLHIMRDHPYHSQPVMGGMFGWLKQPGDKLLGNRMQPEAGQSSWGADLQFLNRTLLREAESVLVHDSCGTFDDKRNWLPEGSGFVGEYIDQHGQHNEQHRRMRLDYLRQHGLKTA